MKKMFAVLAMVLFLTVPVMASDLYDNGYYYEDQAVKGGYVQGMLPVQGVAINGAIAYGDFGMSADFAALQALPMAQAMAGIGNAGAMTHNTYSNESTQINLDRIVLNTTGGWNGDYYDYYYGYNYYNINVYNPNYNYYYNYYPIYNQNGYGEYDVNFSWTNLDLYKYSNENSYLTIPLPGVLETSAMQAGSNSITFEGPGMKLKMDQSAIQAGKLKVVGYGISSSNGYCD